MKRKIVLALALLIAVTFVGCNTNKEEVRSGEPALQSVKMELTVQKIAPTQESVLEEVTFRLYLPEYMKVVYNLKIPSVMDGDTEYLRTSSMSSGVTQEMVLSRQDEEGATAEILDIGDYNVVLVTEPARNSADGFEYTYYLLFDDNTVLPLTFFASTENDADKAEFSEVVRSFELV